MKTIYFPDQTPVCGAFAATIGFFDGVHRGHRFLLQRLKAEAAKAGLQTMAITFERHPRQVVQPQWQPELLTTLDEKRALIEQAGIDTLVVLRFDREMAALGAGRFMDEVLMRQLGVRLLLTGYDNRFGHDRTEGFADYVRYGSRMGMEVVGGEPFVVGDETVSSSRIRRLLSEGSVDEAGCCLGYPYILGGTVVHGEQIGRTIGYPTANLQPDASKLIPKDGVYAVLAQVEGYDMPLRGITNIGTRPTFDGRTRTLETNLLEEKVGSIYGRRLTLLFHQRLRDEQTFASADDLARQIAKDIEACRNIEKLKIENE